MVCDRCIMVVRDELEKLGLNPLSLNLGEVELAEESINPDQMDALDRSLANLGFERIDDRKSRLIEAIKNLLIHHIHYSQPDLKTNWSDLISSELNYEYNYLSNLFSSVEGTTIENYIIRQKIEKVKELLVYDELTLSEIAWKLGYSSVAHLSSQFKKITGFTPGAFRKMGPGTRNPLDKL